jgi:hypothetical protein
MQEAQALTGQDIEATVRPLKEYCQDDVSAAALLLARLLPEACLFSGGKQGVLVSDQSLTIV